MSLKGRNILVAEDELVITLALEQAIADAGGWLIGPAPSISDALRLLNVERVDGAILDIDLHGEGVTPIVDVLLDRRVPFIFYTGLGIPPELQRRCPGVPIHIKPVVLGVLVRSLADLMVQPRQPQAA